MFVQRIDKALPLPQLVFADILTAGLYYSPHKTEEEISGVFIPRNAGIIACSTRYENTGATLAHEWRHHWQWFHGEKFGKADWVGLEDYESELRSFFASADYERDALRFEMWLEPSECHDEWRRILEGII